METNTLKNLQKFDRKDSIIFNEKKTIANIKIIKTKSYSKFKLYSNNRPIDYNHVKKIQTSIVEQGLKTPLAVKYDNGYYYIADGQHRFYALKNLNQIIVAIVSDIYNSDSVLPMNINDKGWNVVDYVIRYAKEKNPTYIKLIEMYSKYKKYFTAAIINMAFNLKGNSGSANKLIKTNNGINYSLNIPIGKRILDTCIEAFLLTEKKEFLQSKFARALKITMLKNKDNFKIDVFLKKILKRKIIMYNNEGDVVKEIIECYNYCNKKNKII